MNGRYLSPQDATEHFGVTKKTLVRWRQDGKIEAIRPGTSWYYRVDDDTAPPFTQYISAKQACESWGITWQTLTRWREQGRIDARLKGKQWEYRLKHGGGGPTTEEKKEDTKQGYIYCRVSTRGQKDDLERQCQYLTSRYPDYVLIRDLGVSGLNFRSRRGFRTLVDRIMQGVVSEIVVSSADRLLRHGFELLEQVVHAKGGKITVLHQKEVSAEQELVDDVLTLLSCYSSRLYGLRSHMHSIKKSLLAPNQSAEKDTPCVDGAMEMVLQPHTRVHTRESEAEGEGSGIVAERENCLQGKVPVQQV